MKAIKETVGNATIVIQTMDEKVELIGEESGRATQLTSIKEQIKDAYSQVKSAIREIANDIGIELKAIDSAARPNEVEMEFQIGYSIEVGPVLVLGGKGEYAMVVRMTWDLSKDGK